jgi:uncharacterized protein YbaR (Trm112 family)
MKRLLLFALAVGGAIFWWRRQNQQPAFDTGFGASSSSASAPVSTDPPKLGGDVDPELLAILACPLDKQPVTRQGNYLVCAECHRHYPIREGIPVMLIDEALTPEQAATSQ